MSSQDIDYWKKEVQLKDVVIDTLQKENEKQKTIIKYLIQISENNKQVDEIHRENAKLVREIDKICPQ